MNHIEFEITSSLTPLEFIKAKIVCGMAIVLKQSKWLTNKEGFYRIEANVVEDVPIYICHPDIVDKVKKLCEEYKIEIIDYNDYIKVAF